MARMAKLTSKNQLTLPKQVVESLGNPSHFQVQVHDGVLLLWPGRLVSAADGMRTGDRKEDSVGARSK